MVEYKINDNKIVRNCEEIEIYGEYDVVVAGGGVAGVGAGV